MTTSKREKPTEAEQQLARGQVQDLQHGLAVLLVLLQQRSLSDVKDPDAALVEAAGQLVAVWVVGTALDDLPGGCQLKQLGMGGEVPPSDGPIGRDCTVLAPTAQTLSFLRALKRGKTAGSYTAPVIAFYSTDSPASDMALYMRLRLCYDLQARTKHLTVEQAPWPGMRSSSSPALAWLHIQHDGLHQQHLAADQAAPVCVHCHSIDGVSVGA